MFSINEKEIVDLTGNLIQQQTVNPPGDEYLCKDIVVSAMKKLGMEVEIKEKKKGRTNVIGKVGGGVPSVALISHMDVVPAGDGWKTNPFEPMVKDGKIFGRGALDNKGCFSVSWAAIKAFLRKNPKFTGTIYLIATADEECGSEYGVKYLLEEGFKVDFAIVPDNGLIDEVVIGEKGVLWLKVSSFGKQAHGSEPQLGVNAVEKLAKFTLELQKIDFGQDFNPAFESTTQNIGQFQGGEAPNIVPAYAEAKIDIRFPLGIERDEIYKEVKNLADGFCQKDPQARFEIEVIQEKKPHLVEKGSFLVQKFLQASRELKLPIKLTTVGGITVAKDLFFAGIPAIAHYPAEEKVAHMANEYVGIKNLVTCAGLYALAIEKILVT